MFWNCNCADIQGLHFIVSITEPIIESEGGSKKCNDRNHKTWATNQLPSTLVSIGDIGNKLADLDEAKSPSECPV